MSDKVVSFRLLDRLGADYYAIQADPDASNVLVRVRFFDTSGTIQISLFRVDTQIYGTEFPNNVFYTHGGYRVFIERH